MFEYEHQHYQRTRYQRMLLFFSIVTFIMLFGNLNSSPNNQGGTIDGVPVSLESERIHPKYRTIVSADEKEGILDLNFFVPETFSSNTLFAVYLTAYNSFKMVDLGKYDSHPNFEPYLLAGKRAVAWGYFETPSETNFLLQTHLYLTNSIHFPSSVVLRALGFLEGVLTNAQIFSYYKEFQRNIVDTFGLEKWKAARLHVQHTLEVLEKTIHANDAGHTPPSGVDPDNTNVEYFRQTNNFFFQLRGIYEGFSSIRLSQVEAIESPYRMDFVDFVLLNVHSDIFSSLPSTLDILLLERFSIDHYAFVMKPPIQNRDIVKHYYFAFKETAKNTCTNHPIISAPGTIYSSFNFRSNFLSFSFQPKTNMTMTTTTTATSITSYQESPFFSIIKQQVSLRNPPHKFFSLVDDTPTNYLVGTPDNNFVLLKMNPDRKSHQTQDLFVNTTDSFILFSNEAKNFTKFLQSMDLKEQLIAHSLKTKYSYLLVSTKIHTQPCPSVIYHLFHQGKIEIFDSASHSPQNSLYSLYQMNMGMFVK